MSEDNRGRVYLVPDSTMEKLRYLADRLSDSEVGLDRIRGLTLHALLDQCPHIGVVDTDNGV